MSAFPLLEDGVKQGIDAREGASTRSNAAVGVTGVGVCFLTVHVSGVE